jgi:hypothetical protein
VAGALDEAADADAGGWAAEDAGAGTPDFIASDDRDATGSGTFGL